MEFKSRYKAKQVDENGFANYTMAENDVWQRLYDRQIEIIQGRACDEYIVGLEKLKLSHDKVPQLPEVSERLTAATGWSVVPVPALITPEAFFELLTNRQFPAATFIRVLEELDYVKEPDIFHEIFGHCPMLTDPIFAKFVEDYATQVLSLPQSEWPLLQRLFWFTVEFGLVNTKNGVRAYGGGILSSIGETVYAVESEVPQRLAFDAVDILRTPYRIDMKQVKYFVLNDFQQLYDILNQDVTKLLESAHQLGEHKPTFPVDQDNPNIHINWC